MVEKLESGAGEIDHIMAEPSESFTVNLKWRSGGQHYRTISVKVTQTMTVLELKRAAMAEHHRSMQDLDDLSYKGTVLDDEELLVSYEIGDGAELNFSVFKRGRKDIGVFDESHEGKAGSEILKCCKSQVSTEQVNQVIQDLQGNLNAEYQFFPAGLVSQDTLSVLIRFADLQYESATKTMSPEDLKTFEDFKVKLLKSELINMLGQEVFQRLETLFGDSYDEILIRRCQAHDKFINFHTDVSLKTLQLALNGDEDYEGGRLVYMNGEGMIVPKREAGSITIHDNQIVHGVTNFTKGTRYGLFLLKKRTSLIK